MSERMRWQWGICALASLAVVLATAGAHAGNITGWVRADRPNAKSPYTPNRVNSYNSKGGAISITPLGTGSFEVSFGRLYNAHHLNNVQVTAYHTNGYCNTNGWDTEGPGKAATMAVLCYDAGGNPANLQFSLEYQQRTAAFGNGDKGIAFLLANEPTTASYTPDTLYNFNSTGVYNTVVRNGTGFYSIAVPGLGTYNTHGDVQVTEYNGSGRCNVFAWGVDGKGANGSGIQIGCFDHTGAAADESFSLAYAVNEPIGFTGSATARGAFAWANEPTTTTSYNPSPFGRYNGFRTGLLSAKENATGLYTVTIPGSLSYNHSHALVTAQGGGNGYCNAKDWGAETIDVECFSQGGTPVSTYFDVVFQTED